MLKKETLGVRKSQSIIFSSFRFFFKLENILCDETF